MKILNVVGARPNFMKIAPIIEAINKHRDRIDQVLVHTGQHYDEKMSNAFFEDLDMPKPDIDLGSAPARILNRRQGSWLSLKRSASRNSLI